MRAGLRERLTEIQVCCSFGFKKHEKMKKPTQESIFRLFFQLSTRYHDPH
jgi:hypothetical protein